MNNRQRHLRYKRSVYARRRVRVAVWTAVAVLCVLLLLFLIFGNLLNNKVEADRLEDAARENAALTEPVETLPTPPAIQGQPVYLVNSEGAPLGSLESQYRKLSATTDALVLSLDGADGTLRYRSSVATALGGRSILSGSRDLGSILNGPNNRGFYISASLTLSECREKDDLIRSAKLSLVASLVCEAIQKGADDVLLLAPDATPEQLPELILLAETVHSLLPEAVVGLSISEAILSDKACATHLDSLSKAYNYMALDRSEVSIPTATDNGSWLLGNYQYYAIRYEMRLILPNGSDDQKAVLDAALAKGHLTNWQYDYQ